ncbi:MAG: hypothetical protein ABIC40_05785 [bacterium]
MSRIASFLTIALLFPVIISCTNTNSAVSPALDSGLIANSPDHGVQTHLWGYYDVYIDIETRTAEAVEKRNAMFTANVVNFINPKPAGLGFHINDTSMGTDYIDVDIDVSITHPFPGLPQYNGYDVRGVFMGDGSASLNYNPDLIYPVLGTDQFMLADPDDGYGGPDGYTRWFNKPEFSKGGMPLFQYTQGKFATPGFTGTATLNAYKYFADDLGSTEELWTWLNNNADSDGRFGSGETNTRNYYLRFPKSKGTKYGYAIIADWAGVDPADHPSNPPEAVACAVTDVSNVWYVDPTQNGGNLRLDINIWNWENQPSDIFIESTVLSAPHQLTASEMIPIGGDDNYSTYHVEIPADGVSGTKDQEYWVIAQYDDFDYTNDFGVPNLANTDQLAGLFRYDLTVSDQISAWIEITTPNGGEEWLLGSDEAITWESWGVSGTIFIEYSKDDFTADLHTIATDEINDGNFLWENIPNDFSDTVRVRISSTSDPSINDISDDYFSITGESGWARTWGGKTYDEGFNVETDSEGNIYISGYYRGTEPIDFDPGSGEDWHTPHGPDDVFLSKFDSSGNFIWAKTWGGDGFDYGYDVKLDSNENLYVTGCFQETVDFDPGSGVDLHTVHTDFDAYLSKFDKDGNFIWAKTWGGTSWSTSQSLDFDESDNIYVAGHFVDTTDFDPGSGAEYHTSNGAVDVFLSKFNPSGAFIWAKTWGGSDLDYCYDAIMDGSNCFYLTGLYSGTVDFNPGTGTEWHTSNGSVDAYLTKFDQSGNFIMAKTWGGSDADYGYGTASDGSDNIYVTGYFGTTVDFDPGTAEDWHVANGYSDAYLSKFDSSGNFQWAKTWGGEEFDFGLGVVVDGSSDIYITGAFSGSSAVDFDPGTGEDFHTSNGSYDIYLSKFDSSGSFIWAKTWGANLIDLGATVTVDDSGIVCMTGYYYGTVDFDPSAGEDFHTSNGYSDIFLSRFLPDGSW